MQGRRLLTPGHELIGGAGHGGHDDCHFVSCVHFALDMAGDAADAIHVGDGSTAELHHQAGHNALAHLRSVPVPTFVFLCGTFAYERRNQRDTSKYLALVWLWI